MSAPDAEKWQAAAWEVLEAARGVVALTESVARRRALEELNAMADEILSGYYGGKDPEDPGLLAAHKIIVERVAEIRAEEPTPPSASTQTATP